MSSLPSVQRLHTRLRAIDDDTLVLADGRPRAIFEIFPRDVTLADDEELENSTRSTLMEVEQIKRQPRGRPQSEAKARTEMIGDSTKCGRHARACLQDLTCDIGGTGFDPLRRCDCRTLVALNCSSRSERAIQVGGPYPSAAGTGRRQSAVPFTPRRACARPELHHSGLV